MTWEGEGVGTLKRRDWSSSAILRVESMAYMMDGGVIDAAWA